MSSNQIVLDEKQVEKISEIAENPLESLLPSLIFELGLKAYEVENLDLSDLTEKEDHWKVSVESRDGERTLILVESIPELEEWLEYRPETEQDSLLVKNNGERLNHQEIYLILKKLGAKAKESEPNLFGDNFNPKNLTIYDLRLSSAKHKLESGFSEARLQHWFGWTSNQRPRKLIEEFGGPTI